MPIEKTVFISYRRTNVPWALAVYQNLTRYGYDVFFDYNSIDSGDFEQIILNNIESRAHFIVLLTPSALERVNEPNHWLLREIEYAMQTKRNIVPLMLEGFSYTSPSISKYLTGKLANLPKYNAQRVPADFFEEAMAKIRNRFLNVDIATVVHPRNSAAKQAAARAQQNASTESTVSEDTLTAQEWFEKGLEAQNANNNDDASAYYTKAIELKPDYAEAYNNRGLAYTNKHDFQRAIEDYNHAITLKPDYALAYMNRGSVHGILGDEHSAIEDYNHAIALKPNHAEVYYGRARARKNKGDMEGTIADYNRVLEINPNFIFAYSNRALVHAALGNVHQAIQDNKKALSLGYHTPSTLEERIRELKKKL